MLFRRGGAREAKAETGRSHSDVQYERNRAMVSPAKLNTGKSRKRQWPKQLLGKGFPPVKTGTNESAPSPRRRKGNRRGPRTAVRSFFQQSHLRPRVLVKWPPRATAPAAAAADTVPHAMATRRASSVDAVNGASSSPPPSSGTAVPASAARRGPARRQAGARAAAAAAAASVRAQGPPPPRRRRRALFASCGAGGRGRARRSRAGGDAARRRSRRHHVAQRRTRCPRSDSARSAASTLHLAPAAARKSSSTSDARRVDGATTSAAACERRDPPPPRSRPGGRATRRLLNGHDAAGQFRPVAAPRVGADESDTFARRRRRTPPVSGGLRASL